ncbi:cell division protein FtsA [Roseomonas sp. OT10]|uniref:cell division protein FtsA n=1 Tax=Roseomonas cutis TaxID=2897332 RepID=UPI001E48A812|nr:cell division protein FtsA [Roseomonas sp. OT10]UFN47417.1 cell division protein FtsA [Roseomonas sp. OT10]
MNEMIRLPVTLDPPSPGARRRRARSGTFGVLDLGSTKVVCLIARIEGDGRPRVLGYGWKRSHGVKGGNVVDLVEAEHAVRGAVAQAEEMADHKLSGVICNLSCGQPESRVQNLQWTIGGRAVTEADLRAVIVDGRRRAAEEGRESVHAVPLGFTIDATPGVDDPRAMVCETLGARLHLVGAASASLRNLGACLAGCDLEVEELVSSPFAAALAVLVDDEKELGATVVDMGGGCTSLAVIQEGHLLHTAQVPVGGWQVTNDLARGLATPIAQAERIKTLHGGVLGTAEDEKEMLHVPQVGEDEEQLARVPRAMVVNIIRPRLEETLEMVRDRLDAAGLGQQVGSRVVLTGGASQLVGVRELAARILERQVRLARPHPVRGLPEAAHGPGFATTLGLLAWGAGEGRPVLDIDMGASLPRGRFARFVNWLRDRV